jgi:hypothetical protein
LLVGTLAFAAGCATPPDPRAHPVSHGEAVRAVDCARLDAEIARAEQARGVAAERSGNAWKAVVPVAVIARKASGTAAVQEADRKLADLKAQAQPCKSS